MAPEREREREIEQRFQSERETKRGAQETANHPPIRAAAISTSPRCIGMARTARVGGPPVPGPSGAAALARATELHGSTAMVIAGAAPKVSLGAAAKAMHGAAHGAAAKVMHGMAAKVPIGVANGMAAMCGMAAMRGIPAAGGQGVRRQEQCTLGRWRLSRLRGSRWHRRGSRWRRGKGLGSWSGSFARSESYMQSATP